ncbi:MAG: hypothetical protein FJZ64_02160 [Chlamydiae bacterium]|nr:hypothetical protein [Chlamydiota bacterium]
MKNPPGFKGNAFQAEKIECEYQWKSLMGDPTTIDQIEIQNSILQIDIVSPTSSANNWTSIAERIPEMQKGGRVLIKKLILTNFNVDIHGKSAFVKPRQTYFDRLEFENIDSDKGFPTAALIQKIFQSTGVEEFIKDLFSPGGVLSPFNLFGSQTEPSEQSEQLTF